ncbi:tyrosine-type recombinase/integrase [Salinarchaeum laminariae]|uniref:tyrosine-type recombinase/integrase n=1 Tax=Salinarchaeum laminariae TaxID=869888 RepID=UPI0020BFD442|nr:site-specific integrase [Salinarchaeum laminariae]
MDMIDSNPLDKWHSDKKEEFGLTRSTEQSRKLNDQRYATDEDEVRLMEENVGRHLIRDQLIIRCLWQMGMRRGELAGIELRDIEREDREVTIREQVAKNDEMRVLAYQPSLDGLMKKWLDEGRREEMAAGAEHGRFLVGERGAPLSGDRINDVVKEAARRAGINELLYADANATEDEEGTKEKNRWKISAHAIRHGFGTYLVHETDAGLWEVSQAMGHHSVKVTEGIYVDDDPRAGIDHVHMYGPD